MVGRILLSGTLQFIPREWRKRLGVHLGVWDLRWSLEQLKRFGFSPTNVLDVGAFQGDWARTCLSVYPHARITFVEPQDSQQQTLANLVSQTKNIRFIQVLLGRTDRSSVPFSRRDQEAASCSKTKRHRRPSP